MWYSISLSKRITQACNFAADLGNTVRIVSSKRKRKEKEKE